MATCRWSCSFGPFFSSAGDPAFFLLLFLSWESILLFAANDFQDILVRFQQRGFPSLSAFVATPAGTWAGTAGQAGVETGQDAAFCHQYHPGSVAKMYTVVAALQQVANGHLGLDEPIDKYLPSRICDQLPNGHSATVRQLMNHTSGIPDHDDEDSLNDFIDANRGALPPPEVQLSSIYDNDPWFVAGAGLRYSSANTLVLALLLDELFPQGHQGLILDSILAPLQLEHTLYQPSTPPEGLLVVHSDGITRSGHSGATIGGAANVYYYPENDAYLVLLANYTPEFSDALTDIFYNGQIKEEAYLLGAFESVMLR